MSTPEPNPYARSAEDPVPPRVARPGEASSGQRLAGGWLIANAVLNLLWVMMSADAPAAPRSVVSPSVSLVSVVIDLLIGTSLLRGRRTLVAWATVRVALGLAFFTATQIGDPFAAVAQIVICGGLLLLLVGDAGKPRMIAGASLCGLYMLVAIAGLVGNAVGANPLRAAALKASGDLARDPVSKVTGLAYPYTLELPAGKWYARSDAAAKKDQPLADRWLMRPDKDAHVIVIAEHLPGKTVELEAFVDASLKVQKESATNFTVVDRTPLRTDPEGGRLLHVTFSVQGMEFERYAAAVTVGERAFQVLATVERSRFADLSSELGGIVESFRLPADAAQLSAQSELEPSPVDGVTGVAYPYELKTPGRRWYLRKAEAAKKDQPLADRWLVRPDKGAHVIVIAEHAPGSTVLVDAFTDQVIENAKARQTELDLRRREPLKSDPARGRFVLASVTTQEGMKIDYAYGLVGAGDRGFQVIGFADHKAFPLVEEELRRIIESFRLPP